jgi:hypothetical protein
MRIWTSVSHVLSFEDIVNKYIGICQFWDEQTDNREWDGRNITDTTAKGHPGYVSVTMIGWFIQKLADEYDFYYMSSKDQTMETAIQSIIVRRLLYC